MSDVHSAEVERRLAARPHIWFTPLHRAECNHAIARLVFLRKLSTAEAQNLYLDIEHDQTARLWVAAEMPDQVWDTCADLARRHGPRLGTRTLDTLHVASALELKAERFWTFDERQAKLAVAAGLKTSQRAPGLGRIITTFPGFVSDWARSYECACGLCAGLRLCGGGALITRTSNSTGNCFGG